MNQQESPNTILRQTRVVGETGLSKSTIARLEAVGSFPKRIKLSVRVVGWRKSDIDQFIANCAKQQGGE
jgi:prophage regulatory protein